MIGRCQGSDSFPNPCRSEGIAECGYSTIKFYKKESSAQLSKTAEKE